MFNQKKINPENVIKIKEIISKKLKLPETTILSIAELNCHEPDCPPKETVITASAINGTTKSWKIAKSIDEIKYYDIENLFNNK